MKNNTYSLDENFPKASIETISQIKHEELDKLFKTLNSGSDNGKKIQKLIAETREMIPQIDQRIHYWENRRTQFLQIALGILAAALAGFVAITPEISTSINNQEYFSFTMLIYIPIFFLALSLIVGCTKILILWNNQNNPSYPFTKGTKTWRWQYRHAETTESDTDFQKFNEKKFEEQAYIFANNLVDYKSKTISADEIELLDQDLSQLYLLIINEKFKIKFVNKLRDLLRNWLKYSFIVGLSSFTILFIMIILFKLLI